MPRQRAEWGSVTELVRGKKYRLRYWGNAPDGYKRRSEVVRGTKRAAYARLAELRLLHGDEAPTPTIDEVWRTHYLPEKELMVSNGRMSQNTVTQYRSTYVNHIRPTFGDVPIDQLKPVRVQSWVSTMSYVSCQHAVKVLSGIIEHAIRLEYVETNVMRARYVMPAKSTSKTLDTGIWTMDEFEGLWQAVHGRWYEAAVLLSLFGSCRFGESLGVRRNEVELRTVDVDGLSVPVTIAAVSRQIDAMGNVVERVKTAQSARTVVLVGKPALRLYELAMDSSDWLVGGDSPVGHKRVTRNFTRDLKAANVAVHPFRNLRNTWETFSRWSLRLPPWVTESLMGHAGHDVTSIHYDRPAVENYIEMVARAYAANPFDADWDF